jgi:hypothetical protein
MNPIVSAASVVASGLSVGLAATVLVLDKELLLHKLLKVLLVNLKLKVESVVHYY